MKLQRRGWFLLDFNRYLKISFQLEKRLDAKHILIGRLEKELAELQYKNQQIINRRKEVVENSRRKMRLANVAEIAFGRDKTNETEVVNLLNWNKVYKLALPLFPNIPKILCRNICTRNKSIMNNSCNWHTSILIHEKEVRKSDQSYEKGNHKSYWRRTFIALWNTYSSLNDYPKSRQSSVVPQ